MKISLRLKSAKLSNGYSRVQYRASRGRGYQKDITTHISVNKKYWNAKQARVTKNHPNYIDINEELRKLESTAEKTQIKYETGILNFNGAIEDLKGKKSSKSLDHYVATTMKDEKSEVTYINYLEKLNTFKNHMNIKGELLFEDVDNTLMKKWKRIAEEKIRNGKLSPRSAREYAANIKSIVDQAFENDVLSDPIILKKKNVKFTAVYSSNVANTTEDIYQAIDRIETLAQWQAVAFWLMQFGLRGLYQSDLVRLSDKLLMDKKLRSLENKNFKEGWINYGRSKSNEPMFIRLFPDVAKVLKHLKTTLVYTHYDYKIKNRFILKGVEDRIAFFNYENRDNTKAHSQLWSPFRDNLKPISDVKILPKRARKAFSQTAELLFGREDSKKLVGHTLDSVSSDFYSNYRTPEMIDKVDNMHWETLRKFKFPLLVSALIVKLYYVAELKKLPHWLIMNGGVMPGQKIKVPGVKKALELKYVAAPTPAKYLKYFIDEKDLTDSVPYEDEKKQIMDLDIPRKTAELMIRKAKQELSKLQKDVDVLKQGRKSIKKA